MKDFRFVKNNVEYRTQVYIENNKNITIETQRKYYAPDEIKEILMKAGFTNISFSVSFTGASFRNSISERYISKNFIIKAQNI